MKEPIPAKILDSDRSSPMSWRYAVETVDGKQRIDGVVNLEEGPQNSLNIDDEMELMPVPDGTIILLEHDNGYCGGYSFRYSNAAEPKTQF